MPHRLHDRIVAEVNNFEKIHVKKTKRISMAKLKWVTNDRLT